MCRLWMERSNLKLVYFNFFLEDAWIKTYLCLVDGAIHAKAVKKLKTRGKLEYYGINWIRIISYNRKIDNLTFWIRIQRLEWHQMIFKQRLCGVVNARTHRATFCPARMTASYQESYLHRLIVCLIKQLDWSVDNTTTFLTATEPCNV